MRLGQIVLNGLVLNNELIEVMFYIPSGYKSRYRVSGYCDTGITPLKIIGVSMRIFARLCLSGMKLVERLFLLEV